MLIWNENTVQNAHTLDESNAQKRDPWNKNIDFTLAIP